MFITAIYILVSCIIVVFINIVYLIIVNKFVNRRNKFSTFECGIDLITSLRLPFSLHFYFVSIIFLIFDVELMMILPFVFCFKLFNIINIFIIIYILILFIILRFFYE